MTISKRLFLSFGVLALALCMTGAAAIILLLQSMTRFEYIQVNTIPSIADLDKTITEAAALQLALYRHGLTTDTSKRAEVEANIATSLDKVGKLIDYYNKNDISDTKDQEMTDATKADLAHIRTEIPQFFARSSTGEPSSILALLTDQNSGIGAAVNKLASDLRIQIDYNTKLGSDLRAENKTAFDFSLWGMVIWMSAVLLGVGAFALGIVRGIKISLNGMQSSMVNIKSSLDLTRAAPVDRMDEIGQTAVAFNSLLDHVRAAIATVIGTTDSVRTAAREIYAGNTDLSARTEEQAASLEETAASMTQLTETVRQNADSARQANMLATNATDMADAGNSAVQGMVSTIGQISASSSKISEITGVIEGIAFQTNILALNAAVEAARAGEQGRGFAVVASEVRNLAQRSAAAAKEIKELIGSSVAMIQGGVQQASEVGTTMGHVKHAIKQVSDIVGEIAAASEEQSRGIEQVNQTVGQMDEVTQQNAALVEQAAAAAQSLEEQAKMLTEAVSVFKVADAGQSRLRTAIPRSKPHHPAAAIHATRRAESQKPGGETTSTEKPAAIAVNVVKADWETF
ncbi:methyl-accepting chemotaxis protein [Paraburkholderia fungorum]|uniref:Methyl-accepting chemotaxis protein n=1 Tax=Paraburkholderia fungorum TaxID=134537 RepID=A0A3R7E0V7_9BURK|nr:methyl-accepting chemotaxis protein [Paraburkholderia fungorum]RKF32946.1 hypothetical protein BCY88_38695 [Paraburkholderia fungorum]